jgi:glycosyltransferase involved in cell wall biosynthesis
MGSEPLVKVVVTTYNRLEWAREAVDSALAQTYGNVHVVIVDDASSDGTGDLAREYERSHPDRVTAVVKTVNAGLADSIRLGVQAGPAAAYVGFLNDDDRWQPELLQRQLDVMLADPAVGFVYCDALLMGPDGTPTGRRHSETYGTRPTSEFREIVRAMPTCGSTFVMRSGLAERAADAMPAQLLSWDYWMLLVSAGVSSVRYVDEPLVWYRVSGSNMHLRQADQTWRSVTIAREELFNRLPELTQLLGGERGTRRQLALIGLDVTVRQLWDRRWREYLWQASRLIRQRQARPLVWLLLHTVRLVARPGVPWPSSNP